MLKVLIAEDEPLSLQNLSGQMRDLRGCTHRGSCERTGGG